MLLIFIGYIFVFFNVQVLGFDLLADFLGFLLIYLGLGKLPEDSHFTAAKPWTLAMAVIHLIYSVAGQWLPSIAVALMGVVTMIGSLYILYMINAGLKEIERCSHVYLKSDKIMSTWRLQAIFTIGSAVLTLIPIEMFSVISTMFGTAAMIMNIVYLFHLISVKEAMDQNELNP